MKLTTSDYCDERLWLTLERICGEIQREEKLVLDDASEEAWQRCMYLFKHINNHKFQKDGINPFHTVQYGLWLYFISNTIYRRYIVDEGDATAECLCDKIFMVNMMITGMDLYYGHEMPDIFLPTHTQGVVFSPQAIIGDYFLFAHGVNVGMNGGCPGYWKICFDDG